MANFSEYQIRDGRRRILANVRIKGFRSISRAFNSKRDAEQWARATELELSYRRHNACLVPVDLQHKTRRVDYITHQYGGWRDDLAACAGSGPGVYIARRNDDVIYIGKASALDQRLTDHHRKWMSCNTAMFPTHFDVVDVDTVEEATQIEADLINLVRPPLNRRHEFATSCRPRKVKAAKAAAASAAAGAP